MLNQEIRNYQSSTFSWIKKGNRTGIQKALENPRKPKPIEVKTTSGFLDLFGGAGGGANSSGSRQSIHVDRNSDPKLNVWQAIKDVLV